MFQIQIKKIDVIPSLLPTPCIANAALQVHIVNNAFCSSAIAGKSLANWFQCLLSTCLMRPAHAAKYHKYKATKINYFLPRDMGVKNEMASLVVLVFSGQHADIAVRGKVRSSVPCSWIVSAPESPLGSPISGAVCPSRVFWSFGIYFHTKSNYFSITENNRKLTRPHMSHKAVNFFQVMGFNSGLKDFIASSRLVTISSHCKGKLVVECTPSLEDVMWTWGNKS